MVVEEVVVPVTRITFAGRDRDWVQVHPVVLRPLQNADVLERLGMGDDRLDHIAQHGVVGVPVTPVRPASDQVRLLMQCGVGDMCNVREGFEGGRGRCSITQINLQESHFPAAGELRFAS